MDDNLLPYLLDRREEGCKHQGRGMAATGIGLAAGLGGGALLLAIAGIWGVNQASKARSEGAQASVNANAAAVANLTSVLLAERASRESWQNTNAPTVRQYVDVQAAPQAQSTSSAVADAVALAAALNSNGLNSAIGTDSFLKVARYSAPQPCGCDTCNR